VAKQPKKPASSSRAKNWAQKGAAIGGDLAGVPGAVIGGATGAIAGGVVSALSLGVQMIGRQLSGSISTLVKPIATALTPVGLLNNALSQTSSGLGLFQGALRVLGASLAPILLPVFFLLATAITAASDYVWSKLLPVLGDWYNWVVGNGIPMMRNFAGAMGSAIEAVTAFVNMIRGVKQEEPEPYAPTSPQEMERKRRENLRRQLESPGGLEWAEKNYGSRARPMPESLQPKSGETPEQKRDRERQVSAWWFDEINRLISQSRATGVPLGPNKYGGSGSAGTVGQTGRPAAPSGTAAKGDLIGAAARDTIRELRLSIGAKPQYSALTQVNQAATLAGLGGSPYEQKMLERTQKALELLEEAVSNTDPDNQRRRGYYGKLPDTVSGGGFF